VGSGLSGIGPKWDRARVRRAVSICASHVAFVDSRALPRRCTLRCCRARLDDPSSLLAPVRTPLKRLCSVCIEPLPRPYATLCFASLPCLREGHLRPCMPHATIHAAVICAGARACLRRFLACARRARHGRHGLQRCEVRSVRLAACSRRGAHRCGRFRPALNPRLYGPKP
jgi:hypothetical protein